MFIKHQDEALVSQSYDIKKKNVPLNQLFPLPQFSLVPNLYSGITSLTEALLFGRTQPNPYSTSFTLGMI